ncbi:MAG: DNA polymerase III subunit gamma/tau [Nitrospiraceae bacterium]|nr:DNA polymerase III subunit gamma/tau [Nitrospiraceae bacterium]
MGYLVLARKWRPSGFGDLVGQEPVARILKNSILQGKIAHAYIFSGPRGVGKTSTARILAKALNCEAGPTPNPCGKCDFCLSIAGGSSMDVLEIDGASNNGVADIRELREMVKYAPSAGRYKVYIIDESHMLSESAFNALLKTLEEPPAHVVFVMATTEPKKIPLTVFSRCQHLPFRRVSAGEIRGRLERIAAAEGFRISPGSLEIISRAADGSIRDSLTILDQIVSVSQEIDEDLVRELLGITDYQGLSALMEAVLADDKEAVLSGVAGFADKGADLRQVLKDFIRLARDILVFKLTKRPEEALEAGEEQMSSLKSLSAMAAEEQLLALLSELLKAEPELKFSSNPRVALEMALLKASYFKAFLPLKEALEMLEETPPNHSNHSIHSIAPPAPAAPAVHDPAVKMRAVEGPLPPGPPAEPQKKTKTTAVKPPVADDGQVKGTKDANEILALLAARAKGPMLQSALKIAEGRIEDGKLVLRFRDVNPELFEGSLQQDRQWLEDEASAIFGAPLKISVSGGGEKGLSKKDLLQKAVERPFTREALELFDGKVVDVKEING